MLLSKNSVIILIPYLYIPTNISCKSFYHVASQTSSIFICSICTKIPWVIFGLFSNRLCLPGLDFTGFLKKLSKSAVAYETNSNHNIFSSQNAKKCRVLGHFALLDESIYFHRIDYTFCKIMQNEVNHFPV